MILVAIETLERKISCRRQSPNRSGKSLFYDEENLQSSRVIVSRLELAAMKLTIVPDTVEIL